MTEKKMDIVARGFHGKWIKVKKFQKVFFIMSPILSIFLMVVRLEIDSITAKPYILQKFFSMTLFKILYVVT